MRITQRCLAFTLLLALGLVACSGGDAEPEATTQSPTETPTETTSPTPSLAPPEEITLTATDSSMELPETLESERVTLVLENQGEKPHSAFFLRVNDGVPLDEFVAAVMESEDALFTLALPAGAIDRTRPGATTRLDVVFAEGQYVVAREEDQVFTAFQVLSATGPEVAVPDVDYAVQADEFFFGLPEEIPAGEATVAITNTGEQGHEVVIIPVAIEGGNGGEDLGAFAIAPAPGGTVWVTFDLAPGTYNVVCFFPDVETGDPHKKLGMKARITVA